MSAPGLGLSCAENRRLYPLPRRIAMVSLHTSPLDRPGSGDAGGLNVYLVEIARRLAGLGIEVDIFTRATSGAQPPIAELTGGLRVHHIIAGPFGALDKRELPAQVCAFASGLLQRWVAGRGGHADRAADRAAGRAGGHDMRTYDVVHSHYWLSGLAGAMVAGRWSVPLVHTMHTMAKVKNAALASGDRPEPIERIEGEERVVEVADGLIANTDEEADQLIELYGARRDQIAVVHPGVDLDVFRPFDALARRRLRRRFGIDPDAIVLAFAGRIQPLKAPDILLRAVARLIERFPRLRSRLVVPVIGGLSGSGTADLAGLAHELGIVDLVRFIAPQPPAELAAWFGAASLVAVPSYSESFGLVALEAQATGTPVVAAAVGGLPTAVRNGYSGVLVDSHDPEDWADRIARLITDPERLETLRSGASRHAGRFDWSETVTGLLRTYGRALARPGRRLAAAS